MHLESTRVSTRRVGKARQRTAFTASNIASCAMVVRTCVRNAFSGTDAPSDSKSVAPIVEHCRSCQGNDGRRLCGQLPGGAARHEQRDGDADE